MKVNGAFGAKIMKTTGLFARQQNFARVSDSLNATYIDKKEKIK